MCEDAAMGLTEKHLSSGERIHLRMRTHWKVLVRPTLILIVLIAAASVAWWWANRQDWPGWVPLVVLGLALIGAVYFFVIPFLRWFTSRYVVTNRRISHRYGILNKKGRDIPLHRINSTSVDKSLWDRMLGCGTLIIADATTKDGLVLNDVPKVVTVQATLQDLVFRTDDGSDDGEWPPNEPRRPRTRRPESHDGYEDGPSARR